MVPSRFASPSSAQSERVGGGATPFSTQRVEHVDEVVHQLRHVEDLNLAAAAVGQRFAARVADAADLVHPVLRRCRPLSRRIRALFRLFSR